MNDILMKVFGISAIIMLISLFIIYGSTYVSVKIKGIFSVSMLIFSIFILIWSIYTAITEQVYLMFIYTFVGLIFFITGIIVVIQIIIDNKNK